MSAHHSTAERTNYSLKIHFIFYLIFPETQRVNTLASHTPLYLIYLIMRMLMKSLIFLILTIVISLLLYSITTMILLLLIFQIHLFMLIYLSMKLKPCRQSRHFSSSYLEVGFTSGQEIVETPKAPHHSYVCIED